MTQDCHERVAQLLAPRDREPIVLEQADRLGAIVERFEVRGCAARPGPWSCAALEQHGEPYTADRLFADLLPILDSDARARIAAARLETLGAYASARETVT
jgi:hypothetical protein